MLSFSYLQLCLCICLYLHPYLPACSEPAYHIPHGTQSTPPSPSSRLILKYGIGHSKNTSLTNLERAHLLLRIHPPNNIQTPRRRHIRIATQQTPPSTPPPTTNQRFRHNRAAPPFRTTCKSSLRRHSRLRRHARRNHPRQGKGQEFTFRLPIAAYVCAERVLAGCREEVEDACACEAVCDWGSA